MRLFGKECATAPRGTAPQVLLVDGDPSRAERLAAVLEGTGARVSLASGAREALRRPLPQVVVCAVGLPDGDGFDLLAELERRGGHLAAVLYTDAPSYADCRRAWRAGAADLLATPVAADDLVAALARIPAPAVADAPDRARWIVTGPDEQRILRELVAFGVRAGLCPAARARLAGAVAEALDNARRHAASAAIELAAHVDDGRVIATVSDDGPGFDALEAELDAIAPAMPGGVRTPGGMARLRALTDDLRIDSTPGAGTRVELRIDPHPAALDGGSGDDLSDRDWLDPDLARRLLRASADVQSDGAPHDLPPALAVALGRLMAVATPSRLAQRALWS